MTKIHTNQVQTVAPNPLPVPTGSIAGVAPLPTEHAPYPPEVTGQVRPKGRLRAPFAEQVERAPVAAAELAAFPDYERLFGALVPKAHDVADALLFAHAWTQVRRSAESWFDHTRTQETLAWDHAMGLVTSLVDPLTIAIQRYPTLADTLPAITRLVMAKVAAGKKAARKARATRRAVTNDEVVTPIET